MNRRFKVIKPYIENKDVLDVGICDWCNDHMGKDTPYERPQHWIHGDIEKHAKSVFGIDILKGCIEFLDNEGYSVKLANAENFDLNRKVDVIVAGELIEHLSNFQGFLNSAKKHLRKDGILILTTPNVFYYRQMLFLVSRGYPAVNPEHTCWFDEITLRQLLDRFGFSVVDLVYMTEEDMCATVYEKLKELPFWLCKKIIPFKKIKHGTIMVIAKIKDA